MFPNVILTISRGVDLNSIWHFSEDFRGGAGEQWQDPFRPTDGFSAVEHVHPDCRAVRRRSAGADAVLRRALSGHGIRAVDLPRESTRHRNLLVGADLETLFHGLPRSGAALDAGRCQRGARLAHLRGVGPAIDRPARRLYVNEDLGFDLANTSMRSTRRPSIFVWRSFRGPISAPPKRRSRCTRCWTCGATSRASSTCRMASCTTFTRSTCCSRRRAQSTSWTGAMSLSPGSMCCTWPEPSS